MRPLRSCGTAKVGAWCRLPTRRRRRRRRRSRPPLERAGHRRTSLGPVRKVEEEKYEIYAKSSRIQISFIS